MQIIVALKQVHDPDAPLSFLTVSEDGASLRLHPATQLVLNAYDANAVEAAVQIKEACGGTVTAVTIGNAGAIPQLRRAIAMGADAGVHINAEAGATSDPLQTALLLAAAIKRIGPVDIVMCGRQASDTDAGLVPFYLAEELDAVALTPVIGVAEAAAGSVTALRATDDAIQTVRVSLPAVLAISNEANKPRVPGLKNVMVSKKAQIPSWSIADLALDDLRSAITIESLSVVERPVLNAEIIGGASAAEAGRALADRLHREELI